MASRLTRERVQGLLIPDTRIGPDSLAARGAGTTDSKYSQASPRAGVPAPERASSMVLDASGDQTDQGRLQVYTSRAGGPGDGGFLWRDVTAWGTSPGVGYQGWEGYQHIAGYETLYAGSGASGGSKTAIVRIKSGKVVAAYQQATPSITNATTVKVYDPATGAWTSGATLSGKFLPTAQACPCLVEIPTTGLLLAFLVDQSGLNLYMTASDDDGASWAAGSSARILRADAPFGATINEVRGAWSNGQIVLFVQLFDGVTNHLYQYALTMAGQTSTSSPTIGRYRARIRPRAR